MDSLEMWIYPGSSEFLLQCNELSVCSLLGAVYSVYRAQLPCTSLQHAGMHTAYMNVLRNRQPDCMYKNRYAKQEISESNL